MVGINDYQKITSHTAKRSFYSNLVNFDVPVTTVELITHPKRKASAMQGVYDLRELITKSRQFYKGIINADTPQLYTF